ncbi:hypothetical protein ACFVHW_04225 [Streptomyces sp. NPDC127110]|uniref:hypothetical protein n=1 Tax=Streptomyces sp. NPDC127110 TaxID=3345362 RepID=UPI00363DB5C5
MKVRTVPLTFRWHLMAWRGGSRLAAGPIRGLEDGRARTIGVTLSICRLTIALARLTVTRSGPYRELWYRDFGRFSIGGWRKDRAIPVSTGWMLNGEDDRIGVALTLASRTVYVVANMGRAEYRAYRRERAMYGPVLRPYSGRDRKKRHG